MAATDQQQNDAALTGSDRARLIRALQDNWRSEMDGARTYQELAEKEPDKARADILRRLAEAELRHAARLEARLLALDAPIPQVYRTWTDRVRAWVRRSVGTDAALQQLDAQEQKHVAEYRRQMADIPDTEFRTMLNEMQREEDVHSKVLYSMGRQAGPRNALDALLRRERWHVRGGGWLGDAIYGANDGLGAVFGIVSGVAGATGGSEAVLIAGLAGTIASALSMGSGAYLATKSEREVYEAEIERERREIAGARTKSAKNWSCSTSSKASPPKRPRCWPTAWPPTPTRCSARWPTKNWASTRPASPTRSSRPSPPPSPPASARSSRSSPSSS